MKKVLWHDESTNQNLKTTVIDRLIEKFALKILLDLMQNLKMSIFHKIQTNYLLQIYYPIFRS